MTTYYASPNGSDSNNGTSTNSPYKTASKAILGLKANDTAVLLSGVFDESVYAANLDGSAGPIKIKGSTGTVLKSLRLKNCKYVDVSFLTSKGPKVLPNNWKDMPVTIVDDPSIVIDPNTSWSVRQPLVAKKYKTYYDTYNNVFNGPNYSLFSAGIWLTGCRSCTVTGCTVSLHTIGIDLDGGSTNITVSGNICHHCRDGIWSTGSETAPSFSASTISDNYCTQNLNAGITVGGFANQISVRDNICEFNAIHQFACITGPQFVTFSHNRGREGGFYSEAMQNPGSSSFNFFDVGTGCIAADNQALRQHDPTQVDGNGFIADTCNYPISFMDNLAYQNSGSGITLTNTNKCSVEGNTCVANGYGSTSANNGSGLRCTAAVTGTFVHSNAFINNRTCGFQSNGALAHVAALDKDVYSGSAPAIHDSYNAGQLVYQTAADVFKATGKEAHGVSV